MQLLVQMLLFIEDHIGHHSFVESLRSQNSHSEEPNTPDREEYKRQNKEFESQFQTVDLTDLSDKWSRE